MKKLTVGFVVSMALVTPLFGQTASIADTSRSIEELYLQGAASIDSISAMITSTAFETQEAGMRSLLQAVADGRVDPRSAEYLRLLGFVLEQGVTTISRNWTNLPDSYHPTLRREAAVAIGAAGPDAVPYLVRAIRNDPEPTVTAEAMRVLSGIPDIDTATASLEVALAIRREAMTRGDETMLVEGLIALEELSERTESGDLDNLVRETAVLVITQGYPGFIRDRAISALARM